MNSIDEMICNARKYIGCSVPDPAIAEKVNKLLSGEWSVEDVLETECDETSTSASAGSGTDRAIGVVHPTKDDEFEKSMEEFMEFLNKKPQYRENIDLAVHHYLNMDPKRNTAENRKKMILRLRRE